MAISDQNRAYFKNKGDDFIRAELARGTLYPVSPAEAQEWLDEVSLALTARSNSEQIRLASEANDAASRASVLSLKALNTANAATTVAIIGIIIAVLAWLFPHH